MSCFHRKFIVVASMLSVCMVMAQPQPPPCGPNMPCKASSFTATKTTGNAITLKGDSGLLFGDGTYQNTAGGPTDGGTTGSGANTQVTYWTGTNTQKGDSNLTYVSSTSTLYVDGGIIIGGTTAGSLAYILTPSVFGCYNGSPCTNYIYGSDHNGASPSLFLVGESALRLQSTSGNVNADPGNSSSFVIGANFNNNITIKPTSSGTDPSIFVTAAQNDAGLNITTPGNGPLQFDGDPIPAVHASAYFKQISMEFGNDAGTTATPTLMSVTFSTAFSARPSCQCSCEGSNTCFLNAPSTTTGETFGCASNGGASKIIEWQCIGPK